MTIPNQPSRLSQDAAQLPGSSWGARLRDNWPKLLGLGIWLTALAAYWQYTSVNQITPAQTVQRLVEFMAGSTLGALFYILAYMLRPAIFFPATLLTLAGGFLYGPVGGIAVVVLASNLSSLVAYFIGRFFGAGVGEAAPGNSLLQRYADRMRRNSFETVLIMRFLFLPYDWVSYFSGFLRVGWQGFLLATALGSIPGTISFVLFGASIEGGFTGALPSINGPSLIIAVLMFVVSLGLSRWFRRRERQRETAEQ